MNSISSDVFVLKDRDNPVWSLGAGLAAPLFLGGQLQAQRDAHTAEQKQAIAEYRRIGGNAFGEDENALSAEFNRHRGEAILMEAVAENARAVELANIGSGDLRAVQQQLLALAAARAALTYAVGDGRSPAVDRSLNDSISKGFDVTYVPMLPCRAIAVAAIAAAVLVGCSKEAPPPPQRPAPEVSVITVQPQTIPFVTSFVAQTESSRQVDIVARVSGFLDKIAYREGDLVREGQLLFQLDPKPFQAQLEAARGEMQSQQARLKTATATLARVKPLAQQNALSQADLDKAQGEFDAATAAVFAAQAKVKEAELNLGYVTIRSPVTGLASRSAQREGAYLNAQSADSKLTYVAAIDPIWVTFSMSQNQAAKLREMVANKQLVMPKNQQYEVELVLSDGARYPYTGKISFADPSFSQDTGSFMVRAVLPNPKMDLRPGMFVTAFVKGASRPDAIVVPQLAVQQGSNGHLVYVINEAGVAEVRPVVVGDYIGEKDIVIAAGLHAGDRVVVDGVLKAVPGRPVRIVEPGAASAPAAGQPAGKADGKADGATK